MARLTQRSIGVVLVVVAAGWTTWSGCSSGPTAVEPVDIDAGSASAKAIEMYDQDGDGVLNDEELASIPGLLKHKDKYDLDEDGLVSDDEIADRIELWEDKGLGILGLKVTVQLGGRPLSDAEVKFVPEAYLGDGPKVATGKTNGSGLASISVAREHLPEDLQVARLRGIFGGTYKIEITHPSLSIPARYNVNTTIGEEIARDTLGDRVVLELERD